MSAASRAIQRRGASPFKKLFAQHKVLFTHTALMDLGIALLQSKLFCLQAPGDYKSGFSMYVVSILVFQNEHTDTISFSLGEVAVVCSAEGNLGACTH